MLPDGTYRGGYQVGRDPTDLTVMGLRNSDGGQGTFELRSDGLGVDEWLIPWDDVVDARVQRIGKGGALKRLLLPLGVVGLIMVPVLSRNAARTSSLIDDLGTGGLITIGILGLFFLALFLYVAFSRWTVVTILEGDATMVLALQLRRNRPHQLAAAINAHCETRDAS